MLFHTNVRRQDQSGMLSTPVAQLLCVMDHALEAFLMMIMMMITACSAQAALPTQLVPCFVPIDLCKWLGL